VSGLEAEVASLRRRGEEALARAEDADKRAADLELRLTGTAEDLEQARAELYRVDTELERVLATRTMRWSRSARAVYGHLRNALDQ
jgi:chromosome segregation ATPase